MIWPGGNMTWVHPTEPYFLFLSDAKLSNHEDHEEHEVKKR